MSQSDYLKYKRISNQLRIDNQKDAGMVVTNQSAVFNSQDLIHYKQYSLANTIVNTKPTLNRLTLNAKQRVYDMDKVVGNCPTFIVCKDTDDRANRVLSDGVWFDPQKEDYATRSSLVNIRTYWDSIPEPANLKNECKCKLGSRNTDSYACACKRGRWGIVR
jgi:hypothetical protein